MKYNSIGEQLITKAKELDPNYKPDKFNDMSEAIDIILNNTGGDKNVPPTLNLIDFETGEVRTTITEEEYNNLKNGLYNQVMYATGNDFLFMYSPSKLFDVGGDQYGFVQFKIVANADETFSYSSMVFISITIGDKNTSNEYPITVVEEFTIDSSGMPIVDCTLTDQTDITKGGTVDNVPGAPFLLRIPLNLQDEGSYGKHLLDSILVPMNYTYGKFEQGIQKAVPNKYSGTGFALSTYIYVEVDISTKKVTITSQVNASYIQLPVNMPTKSNPTVTINNPNPDITLQPMLVGNDFFNNGVVLYGYLFSWASPVYSKDNTMFYYTASHNDVNNTFTIRYNEIPASTTTITFED